VESWYRVVVIGAEFSFLYEKPESPERYILYPRTAGEPSVQVRVTECAAPWTPVPDRETVTFEFVPSPVSVTAPVRFPVADGVKVTFSVADFPGAKISPVGMPLAPYPAPEILTLEMVIFEFP
jgi:hypothetical protein